MSAAPGGCSRSFASGWERTCGRGWNRATSSRPRCSSRFEHLGELKGDETRSLMAWLARIAEHEIRDCADFHQRQRRDAAREVAIDDDAPLPALTRSALSQA